MKKIEELKDYLLKNFVDESGDLMIDGLDLSEFKGDIYRGKWKVSSDLRQRANKVKGNLYQDGNEVKGDLVQYGNVVKGNLDQSVNIVNGNLAQYSNNVEGDLKQSRNKVKGDLEQSDNEVEGKTYTDFDKHTKVMKYENNRWVVNFMVDVDYESLTKEELITMLKEKGEK